MTDDDGGRPTPARDGSSPGRAPASPHSPSAHRWRLVAGTVIALQAVAVAGLGVAWLVSLEQVRDLWPTVVATLGVGALAVAAVLALLARGVLRGRSWSRAPVVTVQLLLGVLAVDWIRGDAPAVGVPVLVSAAAVTVAVLMPGAVQPRRPGFAEPDDPSGR